VRDYTFFLAVSPKIHEVNDCLKNVCYMNSSVFPSCGQPGQQQPNGNIAENLVAMAGHRCKDRLSTGTI